MRVLFFIASLDQAGGTERVCSLLARAFYEKGGHEVGIVSIFGVAEPFFQLPKAVSLFYLFKNRYRCKYVIPIIIWRLRRVVNRAGPDVVITVNIDSTLSIYSLAALWRMNAVNIIWEHLDLNPHLPSRRFVRALAARWADAVVTLTERDVVKWRERPRAPVLAIPNPSRYASRMGSAYRDDARVVLAAGHLAHRKGFDLLIRAWNEIAPETRQGWRLRVVGGTEEGAPREEEDAVRDLVARLGVATPSFVGQKKEMADEYKGAGFFVLSSRAEGFPMVLLEAMSFSLPVVAFDCKTGPAEIIINGKTGLLAPPEDVRALSRAMSRMIGDSAFRSECARQAAQRSREYLVEPILQRWTELLQGLSAGTS